MGDTATEVTSHSASNTPVQRRKTAAGVAVAFTLGESSLSDITKDSISSDHMGSGDDVTRKGSLKRGESEDTINGGDDQNGPGDNVTLSEETVHDLEKEGKMVTNAIEPMGEADVRSDADKTPADVEWAPAARFIP